MYGRSVHYKTKSSKETRKGSIKELLNRSRSRSSPRGISYLDALCITILPFDIPEGSLRETLERGRGLVFVWPI